MMKTLIICMGITFMLSSCYTYKNLAKTNEPVTQEMISNMKPYKTYEAELKSGQRLILTISSVDSTKIYGTYNYIDQGRLTKKQPYEDTRIRFAENTSKLSVHKFNPLLTLAVFAIPIAASVYAVSQIEYTF
ncbi:MAG: hypothetical protein ABL895_04845 [Cyclobacteriaceae bacterium]